MLTRFWFIYFCLLVGINLGAKAQFTPPRILQHPTQIQQQYLNTLNSRYRETNLCISPDGKYLFFMSGRGGMSWSTPFYTNYKGHPEFDGDIWYSVNMGANGWQYPRCLDASINTEMGEDEPNISPDGQTVVFQSWRNQWQYTGGPYYISQLNGAYWNQPKGLGGGITAFFLDREASGLDLATDGATLSADGNIFIVAVGPYDGNMDLYISRKNINGIWSYPTRLTASSIYNERSPFLASDGKTLYFASDGYAGWGGLDILKTTLLENNVTSEILNIGAPFNTTQDDYGFILTAAGSQAYFVRDGDIYFADVSQANEELKPSYSTLMISGIITNSTNKKGTNALVKIIDSNTKKVIAQTNSNSITGEFALVLPTNATSIIKEVTKTGFEKDEQKHETTIQIGLNQIIANVELIPVGQKIVKKEDQDAAADVGTK
ncbi:MAG: hypothetical protein EAZ55_07315 [Cytophagales bacterium]|nr:MAG: hypothetical protein EAZ55_07315 [Cytophagales bacterium]